MRTIVITGASDGIGAAASRQLAGTGARLILVGRSAEKTRAVAAATGAEHYVADFAKLGDVRRLADELNDTCDRIDVLANNAGGMFSGPTATQDGFEKTFQVNHLAPYLLTHLLIDKLIDSRSAVVNTSSIGARLFGHIDVEDLNNWEGFSPNKAYGDAKLANILFTKELHERFHGRGLSSVAFHPGNVATNFASDTDSYFQRVYHGALRAFLISPEQGGARLRHFIEGQPGRAWTSGEYYGTPGRVGRTNRQAYDAGIAAEHWRRSAAMLDVSW
ncbi:SDR family NAD(P)-dependent oxidoreductase [Brachybacterium paraconglomeratum]|uniref:SDR family NAD(P)-dependent oxidoreductase n=1 Tax=Brachybacterium paraconglomeratum TaxID=173362 RepID=UPI0022AF2EA3|nr:SDR family NAD(P)-dependent oxidoreductase [Brachybacterium paraconglomeratum]MCZ4326418.1 SDR family NAD(P)-dependent oxidoreductase [Brachybacterium paraconglomeratum]